MIARMIAGVVIVEGKLSLKLHVVAGHDGGVEVVLGEDKLKEVVVEMKEE